MTNHRIFLPSELEEIERLLELALEEDRVGGDETSRAVFSESDNMSAKLVARQPLTFVGGEVLPMLLAACSDITLDLRVKDGAQVAAGEVIAELSGPTIHLLGLERVMLNIIQRLCGVATLTNQYVEAVAGTDAVILDTRKTIPGWRALDKYAVRSGGGQNHRMHLADAMMIKDNHIAASGGLDEAISKALAVKAEKNIPIVVECDTLEQVEAVTKHSIDRVLLDNMGNDQLGQAVERVGGKLPLEASGGVNLDTVRGIAQTGVDYISVGALTHSAIAVDIGLDH